MAHFTVLLPDHQLADVRSGKVRKINVNIRQLFRPGSFKKEKKTGYIVKLADGLHEYHLLKSMDGKWLRDGEHHWIQEAHEPLNEAIRQAIDQYEKQAYLV